MWRGRLPTLARSHLRVPNLASYQALYIIDTKPYPNIQLASFPGIRAESRDKVKALQEHLIYLYFKDTTAG